MTYRVTRDTSVMAPSFVCLVLTRAKAKIYCFSDHLCVKVCYMAGGDLNGHSISQKRCMRNTHESTRHRWPSGQEELPGLQLVLVVEHHGVDPGYWTVLEAERCRIL